MKKYVSIIALLTFLSPSLVYADHEYCEEAVTKGKEAYHLAKKAYNAKSFSKALSYAEKAEEAAEEAKKEADEGGDLGTPFTYPHLKGNRCYNSRVDSVAAKKLPHRSHS